MALTTFEEHWGEIPTCISTMADEIRIFSLGFLPAIAEDSYNRLPRRVLCLLVAIQERLRLSP